MIIYDTEVILNEKKNIYFSSRLQKRCMLTYVDVWWRMMTYDDVCWRKMTDVCSLQRQYHADVCWSMLTYTDVCWLMLAYASRGCRRGRWPTCLTLRSVTQRELNLGLHLWRDVLACLTDRITCWWCWRRWRSWFYRNCRSKYIFRNNIPSKSSVSRCNRACNSCNRAATEAPLYKLIEPPYTSMCL